MSLFLSTSNLQSQHQLDCSNYNISDTIERECLSVLHKLHDQVNGLQLVQVVVQPLARLFNPASLATLAASNAPNLSQSPSYKHSTSNVSTPSQAQPNTGGSHSSASTPSGQFQQFVPGQQNNVPDPDGTSAISHNNHSRSQSFASSFGMGATGANNQNSSIMSATSTYMMSPDTAQALIARLDTDRDVNWLMEIIGYGLSMPFSLTGEQDSVKDCCTIYCEWLASALLPYNEHNEDSKYQQLSKLVPVPIRKEPNRYARKMLSHLYNVFLPRQPMGASVAAKGNKDESDAILTAVSRQAVLCHRVLRTIEGISHNRCNLMSDDTWNHLLALLLTVNDKLLSPPTEPDDIGTQLHDRILGVLFDLMLLACSRSIPDASMWKTFHEMCLNWRHRPALVEHWKRITSLLTKRVVLLPTITSKINERSNDDPANSYMGFDQTASASSTNSGSTNHNPIETSISNMNYENLSQTWYRFLYLIGNPVELADASLISRTDEFYHAACAANSVLDPRQHPCLNVLPQIFLNSMLGLKEFIDSFVGTYQQVNILSRRSSQADYQQLQVSQFKLNPERPKCDSILHIFGDWLYSAALIGSELNQELEPMYGPTDVDSCDIDGSMTSAASSATATELGPPSQGYSPAFRRKQSHQSNASSHTSTSTGRRRQSKQLDSIAFSSDKITLEPPLTAESFESGQAEAMAALCKIFSSRSSTEDISPAYLARFYLCLQHCLSFGCGQEPKQAGPPGPIKRQLLASVLMNSAPLLQKDLDGINLLIPSFIKAIEFVFECSEKEMPVQPPPRQHNRTNSLRYSKNAQQNVTNYDLRRASILTLVNLLAYPLHFQDLAIRSCLDASSPTTTFGSIRPRLLKLLFIAMQTETDATNMQILFGGLSLAVHDLTSNAPKPSNHRQQAKRSGTNRGESTLSSLDSNEKQGEADTISQSSFVFNSNDGFLIKSLHVTCHLLINIWKHDNLVSLAALEVLTTIARVSTLIETSYSNQPTKSNNNNIVEMKNEYMQTTKWICDYICNQCSRRAPDHSRDMHSTIVAAYQCLSVWFYNHPYLLNDRNCINNVMEVIELGVSGQKSRSLSVNPTIGVATQTTISKGEKVMKPSSLRVREAAELLLNICMVRTCHDGLRNIASSDTVLNELDLAELFGGSLYKTSTRQIQDAEVRKYEAYKLFKYFSDEDSTIFGFMDGMSHDVANKDSVICLLRTPFGKHCWRMKFNYYSERSREKIIANKTLGLIKRPFQQSTLPLASQDPTRMFSFPKGPNKSLYFNNSAKFFPETIEKLSPNDLDKQVLTLDDYIQGNSNACKFVRQDTKLKEDLVTMDKLLSHQVLAEQKVVSECSIRIKRHDCEEPQQNSELETARVIVTQLGLKSALTSLSNAGDKISASFVENLRSLDEKSIRICDTINVFYVRRNRTSPDEILESVRERQNVSLDFFEWLLELGQPVVVRQHKRWTGKNRSETDTHLLTGDTSAYESMDDGGSLTRNQMLATHHGGSIFDGDRMTIHWSDMCQELAFLAPNRLEGINKSKIIICWLECPDDMPSVPCETLLSAAQPELASDSENVGPNRTPDESNPSKQQQIKLQDHATYFVCPMRNGLFKINLTISPGCQWLALPLVDGMTVSKSILASLMRESILNLCRRRRLDADSYQAPHIRRRLKIQEICNSYKISTRYESSEFYHTMFRPLV